MLRGDVYRFKLPRGVGHEQHGDRFGVVVQAEELWGVDDALMTVLGLS